MKRFLILFVVGVSALCAQSNSGELRLKVTDPAGLGAKATVDISSDANEYRQSFVTDNDGAVVAKLLPYGVYRVRIQAPGFADVSETIEIRSALPLERTIELKLAAVSSSVSVSAQNTLIDPDQAGRREPDRRQRDSESAEFVARALLAGPGQFPAGLALRRQRRSAPARLRVSDAIRR